MAAETSEQIKAWLSGLHRLLDAEDLNRFLAELQGESDRAAIILAAVHLDERLDRLIRATVIDGKAVDRLLGPERPLATFGSRILVSYCFGLLSDDEFAELETIRRIRNLFAHERHGLSLATAKVAALVDRLRFPSVWPDWDSWKGSPPRVRVEKSIVALSLALHLREAQIAQHATCPSSLWAKLRRSAPAAPSDCGAPEKGPS